MPNEINKEDKRMVVANYRQNANLPNFLCHFNDTHRCHDPLCYPLLFPFGTDGWNPELKPVNPPQPNINKNKRIENCFYFRIYMFPFDEKK
jgi:hypothetical protein